MHLSLKGEGKPGNCIATRSLINAWLQYHGVYLEYHELDVSYNHVYDFYDIKIYQHAVNEPGHGSLQGRINRWEQTKEATIKALNPRPNDISSTWMWASDMQPYGRKYDSEQIEGIRMFIRRSKD